MKPNLISVTILLAIICVQFSVCLKNKSSALVNGKCSKNSYNEMDGMIAKMTDTSSSNRFPETIDQLIIRCENRTGVLKKMEDLNNRCMDALVKRVVSTVIYSVRRERKTLCRKTANIKMNEFVSAGKCINSGQKEAEKCNKQAMDHIIGIKHSEDKMKIPLICCTFVKFKNCVISAGHKNKECTEDHINLLIKRSEQISNGPMNMACGEYNEETDRCDKLKLPRRNKGEKLPKSLLMPLIEIFESFPQDE